MAEEMQAVLNVDDLENILLIKEAQCRIAAKGDSLLKDRLMCGTIWDGIMCWPPTRPNNVSSQPCPDYFPGLDRPAFATKECTDNGTWFIKPETGMAWTNYNDCYIGGETIVLVPLPEVNSTLFQEYLPTLKCLSQIGYGISLSTLVIAFLILVTLKKLHCSRNMLHLHLFMSFIMKSVVTFAKESLFEQGIGLQSDFVVQDGVSYFVEKMNSNWECKLVTTVWQYFIMANYSWVLMEGLYIHNLIIFALFSDSNSIVFYVILGWGLPLIFVLLWVIVKIKLENELCWTTRTDSKNFLIIRIPIIVSMLLSFILFLNIVRLLLVKVRSMVQEERQRYWKWAKSTLVLIPLFGVHYAVLHGMSYSRGVDERVELVWLFCDQLFASFQGFFVAVLFCFLNSEIQIEIGKKWRRMNCIGNGNSDGEDSTGFHSFIFPCSNPEYNLFKLCFNRSDTARQQSESKTCKRTDTTEFITNDSVLPMIALEREKIGKPANDASRSEPTSQPVFEYEDLIT